MGKILFLNKIASKEKFIVFGFNRLFGFVFYLKNYFRKFFSVPLDRKNENSKNWIYNNTRLETGSKIYSSDA
ncbi:hypothetical protein LEP1GSC193_0249 [Leptospira alstonii serovar Pingchang str. 80-412]|uniref:Uncharacterized protein n=2 Tax=Leptospira alstonii TaxID=28452 RepID=M6CWK7_9LEPT|nr:hypothetical protein LEP1GSC194_3766 [Leptospira alstonii serovar Sichuan str. 79601]EQA81944.1 hypothetical protein LEP1GSC193_0249 [Leptospira alstonii serovar Pingchang str. 80-412]